MRSSLLAPPARARASPRLCENVCSLWFMLLSKLPVRCQFIHRAWIWTAGFVRCAAPALFHAPVRRVRCAVLVRRCGQWVRRILFTISIARVLIWREHVAGCSLPLNTESQAIASCLIPKMIQHVQYIHKVIYCNPVGWQIYLRWQFVTMSDASGSHIEPVPTQPSATGAPIIYCELLQ